MIPELLLENGVQMKRHYSSACCARSCDAAGGGGGGEASTLHGFRLFLRCWPSISHCPWDVKHRVDVHGHQPKAHRTRRQPFSSLVGGAHDDEAEARDSAEIPRQART